MLFNKNLLKVLNDIDRLNCQTISLYDDVSRCSHVLTIKYCGKNYSVCIEVEYITTCSGHYHEFIINGVSYPSIAYVLNNFLINKVK